MVFSFSFILPADVDNVVNLVANFVFFNFSLTFFILRLSIFVLKFVTLSLTSLAAFFILSTSTFLDKFFSFSPKLTVFNFCLILPADVDNVVIFVANLVFFNFSLTFLIPRSLIFVFKFVTLSLAPLTTFFTLLVSTFLDKFFSFSPKLTVFNFCLIPIAVPINGDALSTNFKFISALN